MAPPQPPPARPLSTGGYVVLGLLLDGPATGWDLSTTINRSIAHFWPLTRAHVYAELPKIASRGWTSVHEVARPGAPDRRVHTVTPEGRRAFEHWISTVDLTGERGRQPLQLQLFFAAHADPSRLERLLETWQERADGAERHCAEILTRRGVDVPSLPRLLLHPVVGASSEAAPAPTAGPLGGLDARGMTALFGLRRAQADLAWLQEVRVGLRSARRATGETG